jgi:DNA-binding MarR family transcriptional regulator
MNYHVGMPAIATTVDLAALAARVRLSVMRLSRKLRREGSGADITPTLLAALSTIERHGPMTVGDLASHEQVQKPTVTRILADLTERGLVERTPDPLDGRISWLKVSAEGRQLLQRIRRRHDAYLAKRLRRLSPDELDTLERAAEILERLTEVEP